MADADRAADSSPPSPDQVAELVQSLAAVMCQSAISELDLEVGPLSLRLRRTGAVANVQNETPITASPETLNGPLSPDLFITAPMIGTFYSAATPGAQPFVIEGDEVSIGQTIGIIEAMKIMNEISADRSGTVEGVLVGNGEPVEYGSPLLRLGRSQRQLR